MAIPIFSPSSGPLSFLKLLFSSHAASVPITIYFSLLKAHKNVEPERAFYPQCLLVTAKDAIKHPIMHGTASIKSNPSQMSVLLELRRTSVEPSQPPYGIAR